MGTVNREPMPSPGTTIPSSAYGCSSRRAARATFPASIICRMPLLETTTPAQPDGRNDLGGEAVAAAQLREDGRVARLLVAEAEIIAHQHGARAQRSTSMLAHELLGRQPRQLRA